LAGTVRSVVVGNPIRCRENNVEPVAALIDTCRRSRLQFKGGDETVTGFLHLDIFKTIGAKVRHRRSEISEWNLHIEAIAAPEGLVVIESCI
jgi:hypothetical protein